MYFRSLIDKLHAVFVSANSCLQSAAAYQLLHKESVLRARFFMCTLLYYSYNKLLYHKVRVYPNFEILFSMSITNLSTSLFFKGIF